MIIAHTTLSIGLKRSYWLNLGLTPSYMIKNKNEHGRLDENDFNRINLAGTVEVGIKIFRHFGLGVSYSKCFFNELKDNNMYDASGIKTGNQRSRTNLLTIKVKYPS